MSTNGFRRSVFQTLPKSQTKITCVEANTWGLAEYEWFMKSIEGWCLPDDLKIYLEKGSWDRWVRKDWDFVLVIPWESVRQFWAGNDGMQAWRHRRTGYVVPDHGRQTGGCPEVWSTSDVKGKRELQIKNLNEIEDLVVIDHKQVLKWALPELLLRDTKAISFLRSEQQSTTTARD